MLDNIVPLKCWNGVELVMIDELVSEHEMNVDFKSDIRY